MNLNRPRLSASVIHWQRRFLVERDGERCVVCGKPPEEVGLLEVDHINGNPQDQHESNLRLLCHKDNVREYWRKIKTRVKTQRPAKSTSTEMLERIKNGVHKRGHTLCVTTPKEASPLPSIVEIAKNEPKAPPESPPNGVSSIVSESVRVRQDGVRIDGNGLSDEARQVDRIMHVEEESPEMRVARAKEPEFRKWCLEHMMPPQSLTVHEAINAGAEAVGISIVTARRYLNKLVSFEGPFNLGEGERGHQELLIREGYYDKGES